MVDGLILCVIGFFVGLMIGIGILLYLEKSEDEKD